MKNSLLFVVLFVLVVVLTLNPFNTYGVDISHGIQNRDVIQRLTVSDGHKSWRYYIGANQITTIKEDESGLWFNLLNGRVLISKVNKRHVVVIGYAK